MLTEIWHHITTYMDIMLDTTIAFLYAVGETVTSNLATIADALW